MSGHEHPGRGAESRPHGAPVPAEGSEAADPGRELALLPGGPGPIEIVEAELVDDEPAGAGSQPPRSLPPADGYTPDGVPTLDHVRRRIATGLAAEEAFGQSDPAAQEAARHEALRRAAAEKLASLREELARPDEAGG